MQRMLFLTTRLPFPPCSGRTKSLYYYCKYLREKYNMEIIVACFVDEPINLAEKPNFIKDIILLKSISAFTKLKNVLIYSLIKRGLPIQVSLYLSNSVKSQICNIINQYQPDLLMCDMIRTAEYLKDIQLPKILDMDDLLSLRYQRQMDYDLDNINPYGAYVYKLPHILQTVLLANPIKKYLFQKEISLIKQYEKKITQSFDAIVFVAQREADELNNLVRVNKCFAVPLGVDISQFKEDRPKAKTVNSISFIGKMNVAHNESAIINFCKKIFPYVLKEIPDATLYIIGDSVTASVQSLQSDNIVVTGRVENVQEYIQKTQIFICPLLFGSGIKAKNLEAMAMKMPIVTTTIGAESINAVHGLDWIVVDDEIGFAKEIVRLLKDESLREKIGNNAYRFVNENFSWDVVSDAWQQVFQYLEV